MTIAIINDLPEGTQQQYDSIVRELNLEAQLPPGALVHIAGPRPGGGWRVIGVWESREAFERFFRERLQPARQRTGLTQPPKMEEWPVYKLMLQPGAPRPSTGGVATGGPGTAMNPGDQAPPGTPGTGENVCRECHGTGRRAGGEPCPTCGGTGVVIEGISAGP